MTKTDYILPMEQRIFFLVYDGFEILDLAGPAGVFSSANAVLERSVYKVTALSTNGGMINSSAQLRVETESALQVKLGPADVVLALGAEPEAMARACEDEKLLGWLRTYAPKLDRYGSVCLGAFFLSAAELLNGKKATTHWAVCDQLSAQEPNAEISDAALYVVDGPLWTSAGVTTGIDMALAIVEQDHGPEIMGEVAKRLVVYAHRPGNQAQLSLLLETQINTAGLFAGVFAWMEINLHLPLLVSDMAEQAGMSERNFYRRFTAEVGMTPSKYLEQLRLDRARRHLEAQMSVKEVATAVGFRSEAAFRSAFRARYGLSPSAQQKLHRA